MSGLGAPLRTTTPMPPRAITVTLPGGVIAYDNVLKVDLLGVPEALLAEHGAVSEPVARAMAEGAARRFGVAAAISVTGVAGPGGGTPEKPVGTVWIGCSYNGTVDARRSLFPGSRHEIRARAAQAALFLLHRRLSPAAHPSTR